MNSIINALLIMLFASTLYGCAITNAIHNISYQSYKEDRDKYSATRHVKDVSLDLETGSLYICMLGNFDGSTDSSDQEYALEATVETIIRNDEYIYYYDLKKGCNYNQSKHIKHFKRTPSATNVQVVSDVALEEELTDQPYDSYENLNTYDNASFSIDGKETYSDLEISVFANTEHNNPNNITRIKIKGKNDKEIYNADFLIYSIMNERKNIRNTRNHYEIIGNVVDIITIPIQIPLCIITLSGLCSYQPHPGIPYM